MDGLGTQRKGRDCGRHSLEIGQAITKLLLAERVQIAVGERRAELLNNVTAVGVLKERLKAAVMDAILVNKVMVGGSSSMLVSRRISI